MENLNHIEQLYTKFLNNACTDAEVEELLRFFKVSSENELNHLVAIGLDSEEDSSSATLQEEEKLDVLFKVVKTTINAPVAKINLPLVETPVIQFTEETGHSIYRRKLFTYLTAASIILLGGIACLFYYTNYGHNATRQLDDRSEQFTKIKPGSNKAILTLANGSTIVLTDANNGALAKEAGVEISKTADGQLVYSSLPSGISPQRGERSVALNTIETPKGGQYQVRLPDGSKVWLNAASKLTYPVSFNGRKERRIELSGEAYFEVAKDRQHPFRVKSNGQDVEVLGTHFNINSYTDETSTKTTLLEGSVAVNITPLASASSLLSNSSLSTSSSLSIPSLLSNSSLRGGTTKQPHTSKEVASSLRFPRNDGERGIGTVLKPGQQSILTNTDLNVKTVDVSDIVAWKDGKFRFNHANLPTIMRQLARWYDVDVKYTGRIPDREFTGGIDRNASASEAFEILKYMKVNFKIEGKTVTIFQ